MNTQLIIEISIVAALAVIFILWVIWQIKKKGLKEFAIDMILAAEGLYEKGQNSEKMNYVIKEITLHLKKTKIGKILALFITETSIEQFIQNIFDELKKALDYVPKEEVKGIENK